MKQKQNVILTNMVTKTKLPKTQVLNNEEKCFCFVADSDPQYEIHVVSFTCPNIGGTIHLVLHPK